MAAFAHIVGWGKSVPARVVTNDEWAEWVDTTDEWIRSRTGVVERRFAGEDESTLTLALDSARRALQAARLAPAAIDLIIVATATPEHIFPSTACLVQDGLGALHAGAFDLSAGCSGFVYGLALAADSIRAGSSRNVLVIGAETMSRLINREDRGTAVLFGDGAGAVVVSGSSVPGGILSTVLGSDGSGGDYLIIPAGGSKQPASPETVAQHLHTIQMNGREVFKFATRIMEKAVKDACRRAGVPLQDISLVVPHQANDRIIQAAARGLGLPAESFFLNLDRYGNTSAASIPIALCEAFQAGRIKRKDRVALVGFGAGLTWGAAVIQWEAPLPAAPTQWWLRTLHWVYYSWARIHSWRRRMQRRLWAWLSKDDEGMV